MPDASQQGAILFLYQVYHTMLVYWYHLVAAASLTSYILKREEGIREWRGGGEEPNGYSTAALKKYQSIMFLTYKSLSLQATCLLKNVC